MGIIIRNEKVPVLLIYVYNIAFKAISKNQHFSEHRSPITRAVECELQFEIGRNHNFS